MLRQLTGARAQRALAMLMGEEQDVSEWDVQEEEECWRTLAMLGGQGQDVSEWDLQEEEDWVARPRSGVNDYDNPSPPPLDEVWMWLSCNQDNSDATTVLSPSTSSWTLLSCPSPCFSASSSFSCDEDWELVGEDGDDRMCLGHPYTHTAATIPNFAFERNAPWLLAALRGVAQQAPQKSPILRQTRPTHVHGLEDSYSIEQRTGDTPKDVQEVVKEVEDVEQETLTDPYPLSTSPLGTPAACCSGSVGESIEESDCHGLEEEKEIHGGGVVWRRRDGAEKETWKGRTPSEQRRLHTRTCKEQRCKFSNV